MLEHGGRLIAAAKQYSIPLNEWVDLSTGINPNGWPVPPLEAAIWNRLPEGDDGLMAAANNYYGCDDLLATAGSQAAIQSLPLLRKASRVAIVSPCYAEHEQAWRRAGHQVSAISSAELEENFDQFDVVVIVNPNNPTGELKTAEELRVWNQKLSRKGGWLVVDEAFVDALKGTSLLTKKIPTGLIVLRSIGKFFGLAGARVGFVAAEQPLLNQLAEMLGPWTIGGPSRQVVRGALEDSFWQSTNCSELVLESKRLEALLTQNSLAPSGGAALFQYVMTEQAEVIYSQLATHGVLVRLFNQPEALRFGLPKDEKSWKILENALLASKSTSLLTNA